MTILPLSRRRVAIAALAVVVVAGLGTFGAIRVDASSPAAPIGALRGSAETQG